MHFYHLNDVRKPTYDYKWSSADSESMLWATTVISLLDGFNKVNHYYIKWLVNLDHCYFTPDLLVPFSRAESTGDSEIAIFDFVALPETEIRTSSLITKHHTHFSTQA